MCDFSRGLKEITDPKLQRELAVLEDQEGNASCKFGVVFALSEQTTDAQMLSNGTVLYTNFSFSSILTAISGALPHA